jgi:hypothetical protein
MVKVNVYFGKNKPVKFEQLNIILNDVATTSNENFSTVFQSLNFTIVIENSRFRLCCGDSQTKIILVDKKTQQSWYLYCVDRTQTSVNALLIDIWETDMFDHILVISTNGHYVHEKLTRIGCIDKCNFYMYDKRFSTLVKNSTTDANILELDAQRLIDF